MFTMMITIAAGIGVAALVAGVALMLKGGGDEQLEDRLEALAGQKSPKDRKLIEAQESLMAGMDDVPGQLEEYFTRLLNVRLLIEQADVPMTVPKIFGLAAGLAVAGGMIVVVAGLSWLLIPAVALPLASLPFIWLIFKRKSRWGKFGKQLPEALELMGRGLRAGHSLQAGFQLVGEEMGEPIGPEFMRVFEEQNLGVKLEDALKTMTDRIPNLDLKFFATAIALQRQTGGDLAEILDKIGRLIRERYQIFGQIQALTGEGRLSGIVLMALPPLLLVVMLRLNYDYTMMLFNDPMGQQMLAVAVVLQIVGAFVIRKIINIKV
ncbi:MAG: type II secretion system F family protein [Planctomycetota bacterium]